MEYVTLSNGVKMPIMGYGVYLVTKDDPNMVEWFAKMAGTYFP